MKKTVLYAFAFALLLAVGCEKNIPGTAPVAEGEGCEVTFNFEGYDVVPSTKSTVESTNESKLTSLQLIVWKENGSYEASKTLSNEEIAAKKASISITTGNKKVYVIANDSFSISKESPVTFENFEKAGTTIDKQSMNSFVMAGSAAINAQDGGSYAVTIKRLVAKVILEKVSREMKEENDKSAKIELTQMYLSNLPVNVCWSGVPVCATSDNWYTKLGVWSSLSIDAFTSETFSTPINIAEGASLTDKHYFYCLPNSSAQTFDQPFTARPTRLVFKTLVADKNVRYYPLSILNIQRNKIYRVTLKMTSLGSTDPDDPNKKGEIEIEPDFTVTVSDWDAEEVPVYEEI